MKKIAQIKYDSIAGIVPANYVYYIPTQQFVLNQITQSEFGSDLGIEEKIANLSKIAANLMHIMHNDNKITNDQLLDILNIYNKELFSFKNEDE